VTRRKFTNNGSLNILAAQAGIRVRSSKDVTPGSVFSEMCKETLAVMRYSPTQGYLRAANAILSDGDLTVTRLRNHVNDNLDNAVTTAQNAVAAIGEWEKICSQLSRSATTADLASEADGYDALGSILAQASLVTSAKAASAAAQTTISTLEDMQKIALMEPSDSLAALGEAGKSLMLAIDSTIGARAFGVLSAFETIAKKAGLDELLSETLTDALPDIDLGSLSTAAGMFKVFVDAAMSVYGGIASAQDEACRQWIRAVVEEETKTQARLRSELRTAAGSAAPLRVTQLGNYMATSLPNVRFARFEGRAFVTTFTGRVIRSIVSSHVFTVPEDRLRMGSNIANEAFDEGEGIANALIADLRSELNPIRINRRKTRTMLRDELSESGFLQRIHGLTSVSAALDGERTTATQLMALAREMWRMNMFDWTELLVVCHHYSRVYQVDPKDTQIYQRWDGGKQPKWTVNVPNIPDPTDALESCDDQDAKYSLGRSASLAAMIVSLLETS
jgi:hypothetical protein